MQRVVYSVGHSNLGSEALLAEVVARRVALIADVRAFPGSRRHPQFARAALAASCRTRGLDYLWMPALGGRRRTPETDSPHVAWRVAGFRAYADYMDTPEFGAALGALEEIACKAPTAILCAESLWWQCHRRLVCDRLHVAGWRVLHLAPSHRPVEHVLPDFARVAGGRVVYDGGSTARLSGF